MSTFRRSLYAAAAASLLFAIGCGGDDSGNGNPENGAFLTIEGDAQVFAEADSLRALTVRYHDGDDRPLAGTISFRIEGEAGGSTLANASAVTDSNGVATIQLVLGNDGEAAFSVYAEAAAAQPARWSVAMTAPDFDLAGKYHVESQFNLPNGLPSGELDGLNTFLELTNDPNDPATWILDQLQDELDDPFKTILNAARAGFQLDATLNGFLLDNAPGFVNGLIDLGDDLDQVVKNFGLQTRLTIAGDGIESALAADHKITGALFWIDGTQYEYTTQEMNFPELEATGISLLVRGETTMDIGRHGFVGIPYGDLLVFAIDNIIVPAQDPFASSLTELVSGWVDCETVGEQIADELDFGSSSVYEAACIAGVSVAVEAIEDSFSGITADLNIEGSATLMDGDRDYKVEKLHNGEWEGEMVFNSGSVALERPDQKFVGIRVGID